MAAGEFNFGERLPALVERIVGSYQRDERTHHIDKTYLPSRAEIVSTILLLLELLYPGYFGRQNLTRQNIRFHVGELLQQIGERLSRAVYHALCYQVENEQGAAGNVSGCQQHADELVIRFMERIPQVREMLSGDVQAAYDGDPAATNTHEIVLAYPGVLAVSVYRLAHELHLLGVPLIPRMMSEWAHTQTGVDIHPGAKIGRNVFIDHATGVVIGETTEIGDNVKLYQGVTLGALSFPKDERGRVIRGVKRHPTVKDSATLYANAIVLGGETVIGEGSVIGGSVFVTTTIPDNCTVSIKPPELRVKSRNGDPRRPAPPPTDLPLMFDI